MFCLNKIVEIKIQEHTFKMPKDFDVADFFSPYFGVVIDEEMSTKRIVIRAYGDERYELRDVPLSRRCSTQQHQKYATAELISSMPTS